MYNMVLSQSLFVDRCMLKDVYLWENTEKEFRNIDIYLNFFKWPYQPKWHLALECVFLVIDTKQVGTWYVENARENVGLQFQYMYTLCM